MEFNQKFFYVYGKFYDPATEVQPSLDSNYDLIVYLMPEDKEARTIGSLEGFFISDIVLENRKIVRRDQMEKFEEKFSGKFFSFEGSK